MTTPLRSMSAAALVDAIDHLLSARGWPRARRARPRGRATAEHAYARRVAVVMLDRLADSLPVAARARALGCTAQTYTHYQQTITATHRAVAAELLDEMHARG